MINVSFSIIMLAVFALVFTAVFASHVACDCVPTSDLAWTRHGDTWYAETKVSGSWIHSVYACAAAEHPRTTIAHVHDQRYIVLAHFSYVTLYGKT